MIGASVRQHRLAKFTLSFGVVTLAMLVIGYLAFLDTAEHIPSENHGIVAQNLALMIATAILGMGTVAVILVRPTVKHIEELSAHTAAIESGQLDSGIETEAEDELGSLYQSVNSMQETIKRRIEEAENQRKKAIAAREESETHREQAEQARQESDKLAATLEQRTITFADTMAQSASGDLTARLSVEENDPESLKRIANSFNDMMDEFQTVVGNVGSFTEDVLRAGEESTENIDIAVKTGKKASQSMDEIAADAQKQSQQLNRTAGELESMSANIEEVAASTDELASSSKRAATLSEDGRESAIAAVEELHRIEERSESAVETITALESRMDEMAQIVTTISEIAEQTNMLALNASIEAARAGGNGGATDGFDVVADEVKTLAEETRTSAGEVGEMIEQIRQLTEASATDMRTIQSEVTSGVSTVERVGDVLTDIDTQVAEVDDGVQQITMAMDQQATSLNDVTATVDELTQFSETTAEKTQHISETASEQQRKLTSAAENTHELLSTASKLRNSLNMFTYDHNPSTESQLIAGGGQS